MAKYYALVFLVVILTLGWIAAGTGEKYPYRETVTAAPVPHAYDDAQTSIKNVHITAYYFVPANKITDANDTSWSLPIDAALEDLARFHELQFAGLSHVTYNIHPTAVIGKEASAFYDSDNTERGNPHALQAIADEIAQSNPVETQPGVYRVIYIIYDGVGASGMRVDDRHAALLNKRFLVDPQYKDIRETLVAHEFYHTIGIPDGYDLSTGTSTTSDIMGLGRSTRNLDSNYLDRATLAHLGLGSNSK